MSNISEAVSIHTLNKIANIEEFKKRIRKITKPLYI